MELRGINFGPIWGASGVQGFFGEGYPNHRYWRLFPGFDFTGMTFVAKTTTLLPRAGNMPLGEDKITPVEFMPKCIVVKPFKGVALNAVGLSGPGAEWLFDTGRWQARQEPFFLSFMSLASTADERLAELLHFVVMAEEKMKTAKAKYGLQINFSCPNVSLERKDDKSFIQEVLKSLDVASLLDVPLVPKLNILTSPQAVGEISDHPDCDAILMTNTIPFGKLPEQIDWQKLFGAESPLASKGGGGLSGKAIFRPLMKWWFPGWHEHGGFSYLHCPVNLGGGIMTKENVDEVFNTSADGISIGTVAMLRPWRVKGIIKRAHEWRRE